MEKGRQYYKGVGKRFSTKTFCAYGYMRLRFVAADSLGTRSMATFVEIKGVRIAIDPSTALGPSRYGLPPHALEELALRVSSDVIKRLARQSDVIIVTHYHWDHYNPHADFWEGKKIFMKDPKTTNRSQQERSKLFTYPYEVADGKTVEIGDTQIVFSPPFPHGPDNTRLGNVISVVVDDGKERFLFSSDVQGPISEKVKEWIVEQNPTILYMDGPPTYFLGYKLSTKHRDKAVQNMLDILEKTGVKHLIVDHHLTRDLKYKTNFPVYERAEELGINTYTAAEFGGVQNLFLEAWRKELHKGEREISKEYVKKILEGFA